MLQKKLSKITQFQMCNTNQNSITISLCLVTTKTIIQLKMSCL